MKDIAERVRQLIGIDESYLKDNEVLLPEFYPLAEGSLKRQLPKAFEDGVGDEVKKLVDTAIIYKTAILFIPSLPRRFPMKQKGEHAEFQIDTVDIKKDLEETYYGLIGEIEELMREETDDNFHPNLSRFVVNNNCGRRKRRW